MSDRRGNVSRSYFYRLVRQELVNVENDLHGLADQIDEEADEIMDGINGDDGGEAGGHGRDASGTDSDDQMNENDVNINAEDDFVEAGHASGSDSDDRTDGEEIGDAGHVRYLSDSDSDDEIVDYPDDLFDNEDAANGDNDGGEDRDAEVESFKKKLAKLVIKNKWSRDSTNELLVLLRANGHDELPKTRETLLNTPSIPIIPRIVEPGEYYHFGLKKGLKRSNYEFLIHQEFIEIDVNIDGLSLSKSSRLKMWPILAAFPNKPDTSPFLIGAYVGHENPASIDDFLVDFIVEAQDALDNGVEVTHRLIRKPFRIRAYICDAPARAFLTGTLNFAANIGCNKCDQHCVRLRLHGKKTFLTTRGNLRTDESFQQRVQIGHHQPEFAATPSLLETIETKMVTQVPNDPMHLIDEGISARILGTLFFKRCRSVRLLPDIKQTMDTNYISMAPYVPSEFTRKTRSILTEFPKWKGTEYRFWGLYGGFIILKDHVGLEFYNHYLLFFTAMRLLASQETHLEYADFCQELLERFVENYGNIYDPEDLVYNVHSLLHVVEDVKLYGPLYGFSAYRFENHMREINKNIKKSNLILQQLSKRLEEINFANENDWNGANEANGFIGAPRPYDSDLFPGGTTSYKAFKYNAFILKTSINDNCCLLNSGIAVEIKKFLKIDDREVIVCYRFLNPRNFFTEPIESYEGLGIMLVNGINYQEAEEEVFELTDVKYKLVRLPYNQYFILQPMIHHM